MKLDGLGTAHREYDGPSWGPSCITLNNVYVETPEGKSLTVMTDKKDGPS